MDSKKTDWARLTAANCYCCREKQSAVCFLYIKGDKEETVLQSFPNVVVTKIWKWHVLCGTLKFGRQYIIRGEQ